MKSAVLVVGGGISGMRAAAELLVQGFKVYLLEEGSCIDRQTAVLDKLFPPGECAACALQPLVFELTSNPNSTIFTSSKLLSLHGEPGDFKVEASVDQTRSEDGSRNVELSVGAVIVGVGPETENGDTLERLGLKLGDKGGARRDSRGDHPCYTSRDGVFVCGTTGEPKEIEKSVIQACAAAANVAALLAPAKDSDLVAASGSMHLPIEAKDEPRIFVVVDQGAFHGSDVIDLEEVCEYTRTLTGVKSVEVIPCSCDGSRIVELLSTGDFNCLVVAGPSPITHEYLFQRYAESAGLNRYLVEIVNLHRHCAAVHSGDRKAATNKAKSLMRMGVARVQLLKPIEELRVSITQRCLVVGGSAAGLACAAKLAEMGLQVDLVEMTSDLSDVPGNDHPAIVPLVDKCLAEDRVSIHTQTRMTSVEGRMGAFTLSLAGGGQAQTVQVGAIVMATVLEVQDGDDGAGLEEALAIRKGEDGFYVSTEGVLNVLDFDTAGVFNCGPARAMLGAVDALIEGEAAASRAACIIASGVMSRPPTISSVVDENCDGCAYCVDPCPTRSITLLEFMLRGEIKKVVEVSERTCIGCGICMSTCPKKGIYVKHYKLESFSEMVKAAVENGNNQPVIVSFCCNRCAYPGADSAGSAGIQYPANIVVIRTMCSGMIHPNIIMDALTQGADGVLMCGCHPGNCRSREGIRKAQDRKEAIELMLEDFGLELERFRLEHVAASQGPKFAQVAKDMTDALSSLGPSPYRQSL